MLLLFLIRVPVLERVIQLVSRLNKPKQLGRRYADHKRSWRMNIGTHERKNGRKTDITSCLGQARQKPAIFLCSVLKLCLPHVISLWINEIILFVDYIKCWVTRFNLKQTSYRLLYNVMTFTNVDSKLLKLCVLTGILFIGEFLVYKAPSCPLFSCLPCSLLVFWD